MEKRYYTLTPIRRIVRAKHQCKETGLIIGTIACFGCKFFEGNSNDEQGTFVWCNVINNKKPSDK